MRRTLAILTVVLAGLATLAVSPALADNPSPAQIRTAIRRAERSSNLWTTVNICNSRRRYRNDIGIRGQMPSLGFAAWLSMNVKLLYYARSQKKFVPVPTHGTKLVRLGRSSHGLQQSGALFQFAPHQPTLKAQITFIWRREGKLLGQTTKSTTAGHHNADFASPAHYSAATCTIR
jgi:hypothetical protein